MCTRARAAIEMDFANNIIVQDPRSVVLCVHPGIYGAGTKNAARGGIHRRGKSWKIYRGGRLPARTHAFRPKADRLELLPHTQMHTGQLFMLYSDPQRRMMEF